MEVWPIYDDGHWCVAESLSRCVTRVWFGSGPRDYHDRESAASQAQRLAAWVELRQQLAA